MSSHSQSYHGRVPVVLMAAFAILCGAGTRAAAQNQSSSDPAVQIRTAPAQDRSLPKWELFAGYSFVYPHSDLQAINPGATLPFTIGMESNPLGIGGSVTYNFTRWLGLTGDFSGDLSSGERAPDLSTNYMGKLDDVEFYDASIGPKLTFRRDHFAPFIEGLVGWQRLSSESFGSSDHIGFMGGAGIDLPLTKHFGLRLIQGDYLYSNHQFGPSSAVPTTQLRGVRLQSGVKFMFGGMAPPAPVNYSCSASPTDVFPGDPVAVSGSALNLNPRKTATYSWTSTGGKVGGISSASNIDTAGLAPGTYTVTGHVTEGPKAGQSADCNAVFTVKPFGPPAILLSADPSAVNPGDPSTITAQATSPQNRPLTYSYTASSGQIGGSASTAILTTTGVAPGVVTVTGTVTDDIGQTASPKTETLCSISFGRDQRRPARVDNEAKACLDEVALNLQRTADARAVLVGSSGPAERNANTLKGERAINAKAYLVKEKGIDPSRIEVRTGNAGTPSVVNYLVPSGATFDNDVPDTSPVEITARRRSTRPSRAR